MHKEIIQLLNEKRLKEASLDDLGKIVSDKVALDLYKVLHEEGDNKNE